MMKTKLIIILSIIIIAIILAIIYMSSYKSILDIQDHPINPNSNNTMSISNSTYVSENGVNFYINEDGNRVYVINAIDSPDITE